jgi:hypothetical protein
MTDAEVREKHNDIKEIARREGEVERIQKHGTRTVFEPVDGPKFDFKNPDHNFFVYELSTKTIPPVTSGPPAVRVTQCFGDTQSAARYARALNARVGTTVFIGRAHEWHVCPDTLQDAEPSEGLHEAHRDHLLAEHARVISESTRNTKIREHIYKHYTPASTREWCERAHIDPCLVVRLSEWADANGFTFDRIGQITDAEAQELSVPGPYIRECYETWCKEVSKKAGAAVDAGSEDPVPEDPVPEDPVPEDPVPEDSEPEEDAGEEEPDPEKHGQAPTSAGIPLELQNPAHSLAVVSVVLDTAARARHIFKLYGVFAEKSDAETYIRNVAGVTVKDHDMYVVSTCSWLNFEHKVRVGSTIYRDPELNKIVSSRATQEDLIKRLEATNE